MDVLKGRTIRSYLGSYETFLTFVTTEHVQKGIAPEPDEDCQNLIPKLKGGVIPYW